MGELSALEGTEVLETRRKGRRVILVEAMGAKGRAVEVQDHEVVAK